MTGFEFELKNKILEADSHVLIKKLGGTISKASEVSKAIETIDGIKSISPFTYTQALLRANGSATGLLIRGISQNTDASAQLSRYLDGEDVNTLLFSPSKVTDPSTIGNTIFLPGIIIGAELSRSMGIFPGAIVALLSPQVSSSPMGLVPKYKRYVVTAIYKSGLSNYENSLAYVDIRDAQKFFRMGDSVSGLEIRLDDIDLAPLKAQEILGKLDPSKGFYTQDWTTINKPLWDAIRLEKKVYFIVLLLIIVMASFSIISTLVLLVLEKRGDIAVLRTLGATGSDIANIFRIQGATIGGVGTILGLVLGYFACIALDKYGFPLDDRIFPISKLPVKIELFNFMLVGLSSFAICFLATIYPASRASKLDPANVLRYE